MGDVVGVIRIFKVGRRVKIFGVVKFLSKSKKLG